MSAKLFSSLLASLTIAFVLTGCASSETSAQSDSQREEYRRHAVRTSTFVGHPMTRPSGSDQ